MPSYICCACRGLPDKGFEYRSTPKFLLKVCPLCDFQYITVNDTRPGDTPDDTAYYERQNFDDRFFEASRHFNLVIERSNELGLFVFPSRSSPMEQLMYALSQASNFVHFMTYGISKEIIGAMKVAATRATVIGIVANVSESLERELRESSREISGLHFITYRSGVSGAPHTKLVVVDGEVAFDGSTNLTTHGLRQAEKKLDRFRVVRDFQEVRKLNNEYFSPVWMRHRVKYSRLWMLRKKDGGYLDLTYRFE